MNCVQLTRPSYWKGRQSEFADQWMRKKRRTEKSVPFSMVKIARKSFYNSCKMISEDDYFKYSWRTIMKKSLSRPFVLFAYEPIVQLLGIYMAYLYGIFYRKAFYFPWM
jgi:hypothetical protein